MTQLKTVDLEMAQHLPVIGSKHVYNDKLITAVSIQECESEVRMNALKRLMNTVKVDAF